MGTECHGWSLWVVHQWIVLYAACIFVVARTWVHPDVNKSLEEVKSAIKLQEIRSSLHWCASLNENHFCCYDFFSALVWFFSFPVSSSVFLCIFGIMVQFPWNSKGCIQWIFQSFFNVTWLCVILFFCALTFLFKFRKTMYIFLIVGSYETIVMFCTSFLNSLILNIS